LNRSPIRISFAVAALFVMGSSIGVGDPQQPSASPSSAQAGSPVPAVVNRYCVGCHNTKTKAGDFTLDTLLATNVTQHPEEWEKVIRKLRPRYMPPVGLPRPDEKTYDAVVASLAASIDSAAAARPNPGRTDTFRRLNRTEYQNSIRDLLALDVDIVSMLPGDEKPILQLRSAHGREQRLVDVDNAAAERVGDDETGRGSDGVGH